MLDRFKSNFLEDTSLVNKLISIKNIPFKYTELLLDLGGKTFDKGLYSIHTFEDSMKWTAILSKYFLKDNGSIISFGHDWMGRQFCVPVNAPEQILMYDPATFQKYVVNTNLFDFHDVVLCDSKENSLVSDVYKLCLKFLELDEIGYDKCLGFNTPLFLNGKEELANYSLMGLEFYWDFDFQIFQQIAGLPDGTPISNIAINPYKAE